MNGWSELTISEILNQTSYVPINNPLEVGVVIHIQELNHIKILAEPPEINY